MVMTSNPATKNSTSQSNNTNNTSLKEHLIGGGIGCNGSLSNLSSRHNSNPSSSSSSTSSPTGSHRDLMAHRRHPPHPHRNGDSCTVATRRRRHLPRTVLGTSLCVVSFYVFLVTTGSNVWRNANNSSNDAATLLATDNESNSFFLRRSPQIIKKTKVPQKKRYDPPQKTYRRTGFTLDEFPVAGVNLGKYGFQGEEEPVVEVDATAAPFELFDDFDISHLIQGNEGWWDLVNYRRDLHRPSISFYGDKVAQKRWMTAVGIPHPQTIVLLYGSELTESRHPAHEKAALLKLIPRKTNYVAKPTHKSGSSGVFVVKYDENRDVSSMGYGGDSLDDKVDEWNIASRLVEDLHKTAHSYESWALKQVQPGVMLEDRFTEFRSDKYAATEFKVFTIWGKAWITNWRQGTHRPGLVHRNGTIVDWEGKREDKLPDWVDWERVVRMAEDLSVGKDLFRVDVFVGVPAGSPSLRKGATKEEQLAAVQYVVSEVAFHPTSEFGNDNGIFDEGGRLWLAGYQMGNYRVVPNTEVPPVFVKNHMLSEDDAKQIIPPASRKYPKAER